MKYSTTSYLFILVFPVLMSIQLTASAQEKTTSDWQIGFGAGYTNYSGDLSNYRIRGFKDFYKIYHFADYNKYYIDKPSLSVMVHKNLTPTLGFMIQANTMSFAMSDRYRNKNGTFDTAALHYSRSLNFRTSLQDVGIAFTFRTNNGRFLPENAFFSPSFFLGGGVSRFKVMGDQYDENNQPYNYRLRGNIQDGTFETNLRDQLTENDEKYRNVEPYVDLGLGLNFRFSDLITLSIQSDIKFSATDYLDDVSGIYKTTYATPQQQYIAKPGYNVVNPLSLQRGDNNSVNDFYINNRVMLSIGLGRKKVQKAFVAPALYSLGVPYNFPNEKVDSVIIKNQAYRDSLMAVKTDSIATLKRRTDSLTRLKDTTVYLRQNDSVRMELQSIRTELKDIKTLLQYQQITPRYQQLQYQSDSLKTLQSRISAQRTITREDNLRLRIYQLQVDSVHHEMEKLQNSNSGIQLMEKPVNGVYAPPVVEQRLNTLGDNNIIVSDTVRTAALKEDTVSVSEIKTYNDEIKKLKQDKRYKTDTAFRKNVDSLNKRLTVYNQQLNTVNKQNAAAQSQVARRDTVMTRANQKKIDSLQNRLNELEKRTNTENKDTSAYNRIRQDERAAAYNRFVDSAARSKSNTLPEQRVASGNRVDTNAYNRGRQDANKSIAYNKAVDSVAVNKNISQLENSLKFSNDSVSYLKRQLQHASDSAAYYNTLASTASDEEVKNDDRKGKWYQRMFSSKKAKNKTVAEPTQKEQLEQQQKLYQLQADRTNQQIDDLEKKNRNLSDQYQDLVSTRSKWRGDDILVQSTPPAVVYQNDGYGGNNYNNRDNGEIQSLRAEIDRLRGDVNDANQRNYNSNFPLTGQSSIVAVPVPAPVTTVPLPGTFQQQVIPVQTVQDTAAVQSLRSDLDQLRSQLDSIKNTKPAVTTREVVTNQKFDVKSFPIVSVYFSSGSAVLTNDQIKKITPFAQVAAKNPDATVQLKGFTDPTGNPAVNQAIAKKRSEFVRNLLTTRFKISENRIAADDPSEVAAGRTKKPNPLDRRVDLEFN